MRYILVIIVTALISVNTFSQKVFTPKYTFNIELGLPIATSNVGYRGIMQGLVSATVYQQYSFPFHLNVGAGVKYSYFAIDEFSTPSEVYGGIHTGGAFLKVGYDKFHNDRLATDFGVKVGYTENITITDLNEGSGVGPIRNASTYVEPVFSLILSADDRNSYRWIVGYAFQGFSFKPTSLGFNSNIGYDEDKLNNITQYLLVGFGYTFYFGVKQSD